MDDTTFIESKPKSESESQQSPQRGALRRIRRAAAGKALIVWLATGSLGAAIVAFIVFKLAGC